MNVLITGATGFLGSHLCRRLAKDGYNLTILCRPTSKTDTLNGLKFTKIIGDIADSDAVEQAVAGNEVVFHTAAYTAKGKFQREIQDKINVQGTKNLVKACQRANVKKLVHISSVAAIGIPQNSEKPATEDSPFNLEGSPLNYNISKKRAEEEVLKAVRDGLHAVIVNPSYIWGQHNEKYRGLEIVQKVQQRSVVLYFQGGICIVHIEDVIDGIMGALARGKSGERYILGGENLTFRTISTITAKEQGLKRSLIPVPKAASWLAAAILESFALVSQHHPRITFLTHYYANRFHFYDSTKAQKELGYSARNFQTILNECLSFIESQNGN